MRKDDWFNQANVSHDNRALLYNGKYDIQMVDKE